MVMLEVQLHLVDPEAVNGHLPIFEILEATSEQYL